MAAVTTPQAIPQIRLRQLVVAGVVATAVPPAVIALAGLNPGFFVGFLPIFVGVAGIPQLAYGLVASTTRYESLRRPARAVVALVVWAVVGAGVGAGVGLYEIRGVEAALLGAGVAVGLLSAATLVAVALTKRDARKARIVVLSVIAAAIFATMILMLPNY